MRWIDFRAVVYGGFLTIGMSSAALAYSPNPKAICDTLDTKGAAFAIAEVISFSIEPVDDGGACLLASYTIKELLHGKLPGRFSVRLCSKNVSLEAMVESKEHSEFGFKPGASVLVGLVRTDATDSVWRYASPGCTGIPFHYRLDNFSKDEWSKRYFDKIIREIKAYSSKPPRVSQPAKKPGSTSPSKKRTAAVNTGRFVVQISARKTEADAKAEFEKLKAKYPDLLGGYRPVIKRADLGQNQIWHRLYVGPIESKKAASSLCGQLKSAGMRSCLVRPELFVSKRP